MWKTHFECDLCNTRTSAAELRYPLSRLSCLLVLLVISCNTCINFFGENNSGGRCSEDKRVSPRATLSTWIWISSICRRMWRNTTSNWVIVSSNSPWLVATCTNCLSNSSNVCRISPSTFVFSVERWWFSDTVVACSCMEWMISAFSRSWSCRRWLNLSRSLLFAVPNNHVKISPPRFIIPRGPGVSKISSDESIFAVRIASFSFCSMVFKRYRLSLVARWACVSNCCCNEDGLLFNSSFSETGMFDDMWVVFHALEYSWALSVWMFF